MLSLRTPPGGKVRLRGVKGALWRDKTLDNIERNSIYKLNGKLLS